MTKDSLTSSWFVPLRTRDDARARLICFSSAGSGTSAYGRWASLLPVDVELWGIQLPGHETRLREPLLTDIHEMADNVARDISPLLDLPLVLFGHSMGALVAYETARRLRDRSTEPAALIVSARIAAHLVESRERYDLLNDDDFIDAMGKRYGGIPALLKEDAEFRELYLPPLRADVTAVSNYRHRDGAPLDCAIHALAGTGDATTPRDALDAWREHTTGPFGVQLFQGDHFFIQSERVAVLEVITRALTIACRSEHEGSLR